ncbi:thiol:disulfide interchange protein DsbA/DsbL [Rhodoferax saidenbachensis]|uniref:Thiol:disulfide interchange protein n=1 Tax=Rhodoferax saidenbachensis TaxID=1484693 RepID=A0ABU1ZMH4_9BURK|nr:thiol:disulfide interchange protein DsbA/DsbL [Rhodoferax saidenbachensis]MDR7306733.1 thiol:disulfide interchange protein DsbA [Rhodoferax saidenbachensis]
MKRREFTQAATGAAFASSALWVGSAQAQAKGPQPGTDYQPVDPRAPVEAPAGKVEVVEFFWYSCPHCNAFEPTLQAWIPKLPKDVSFRRVPVAFQDSFVPQQRLYYALEAMGLVEKLHAKVFAAIHAEKQNLSGGDAIVEWVAKQGVDKAKFVEQYSSFSVATKATKAAQLQNAYKVEGVPALGVAGRYYTDGSIAGNMQRALQIVDALIVQARTAR